MSDSEVKATRSQKKKTKKRVKSDLDCPASQKHANAAGEMQELDAVLDLTGLSMAEKLASLELIGDGEAKIATQKEAPPPTKIPSADSLHVLLKQAIHAQDHALLAECLSTTDGKVITNSTALLNPSDVLMLLKSLLSLIELRGSLLIHAIPWLRSLLGQHASIIASQESSFLILNSFFQIPEAEESSSPVVIYEDNDSDEEEEEYDETMEIDEGSDGLGDVIDSAHNSDGGDIMSD